MNIKQDIPAHAPAGVEQNGNWGLFGTSGGIGVVLVMAITVIVILLLWLVWRNWDSGPVKHKVPPDMMAYRYYQRPPPPASPQINMRNAIKKQAAATIADANVEDMEKEVNVSSDDKNNNDDGADQENEDTSVE